VDPHQSSSNTYDLHALGYINALLQACLCQKFVQKLKPTKDEWTIMMQKNCCEVSMNQNDRRLQQRKYIHGLRVTWLFKWVGVGYGEDKPC